MRRSACWISATPAARPSTAGTGRASRPSTWRATAPWPSPSSPGSSGTTPIRRSDATRPRRIFDLQVRLDAVLDLREPKVCAALALPNAPPCFLDVGVARATADYVRRTTAARALLVPSMALPDQPERWVMVLFLEKLPSDPAQFLPSVMVDGVFGVEP